MYINSYNRPNYKATVSGNKLYLFGAATTDTTVRRWNGSQYVPHYGFFDALLEFCLEAKTWRTIPLLAYSSTPLKFPSLRANPSMEIWDNSECCRNS